MKDICSYILYLFIYFQNLLSVTFPIFHRMWDYTYIYSLSIYLKLISILTYPDLFPCNQSEIIYRTFHSRLSRLSICIYSFSYFVYIFVLSQHLLPLTMRAAAVTVFLQLLLLCFAGHVAPLDDILGGDAPAPSLSLSLWDGVFSLLTGGHISCHACWLC